MNEDCDVRGMHLRRFAANFSTPKGAGQAPLPEMLRAREWLQKTGLTMTSVDEN